MKFKIGDRVKAISDNYGFTTEENEWKGIVTKVEEEEFSARTTYSKNKSCLGKVFICLEYKNFEKDDTSARDDLQFGDILTLRNGERFVYADGVIHGESEDYYADCDTVSMCYDNDLIYNSSHSECDVMKVERNGIVVFEREEVKEMTIAEISEALGYEVKVVKE